MDRTVSILGCGWLGLPLGEHLVQRSFRVKGSTTSPEKLDRLRTAGIEPYQIVLDPDLRGTRSADFFDADVLFLNVPPGRRRPDVETYHLQQIEAVQSALKGSAIDFVVFASSTSVYPNTNRVVTEEDAGPPARSSGAALLEAERRLMQDSQFDTTVVRFAGLYGYDRQPGRFLAGRKEVANGDAPVNLIHRDDCIAIVAALIEADVRGEVFNACANEHPTRRVFYTQEAERLGLEPPSFADEGSLSYKVVSNQKLKETLGYRFQHPDPLEEAV